jgi:hypothetical protein
VSSCWPAPSRGAPWRRSRPPSPSTSKGGERFTKRQRIPTDGVPRHPQFIGNNLRVSIRPTVVIATTRPVRPATNRASHPSSARPTAGRSSMCLVFLKPRGHSLFRPPDSWPASWLKLSCRRADTPVVPRGLLSSSSVMRPPARGTLKTGSEELTRLSVLKVIEGSSSWQTLASVLTTRLSGPGTTRALASLLHCRRRPVGGSPHSLVPARRRPGQWPCIPRPIRRRPPLSHTSPI